MKTIDLAGRSPDLRELLQLAGEDNLILRTGDGREFVFAEVDDFEREVGLVRGQQELMELLDRRSTPEKSYSLDQARRALGLD